MVITNVPLQGVYLEFNAVSTNRQLTLGEAESYKDGGRTDEHVACIRMTAVGRHENTRMRHKF